MKLHIETAEILLIDTSWRKRARYVLGTIEIYYKEGMCRENDWELHVIN